MGFPVGETATVAAGPQAGPCDDFNIFPDIYTPPSQPPVDSSNPNGVQGAFSAKLTCT